MIISIISAASAPFLSPKVCFFYRRVLKGALRLSLAGSQVPWWLKVHLSLVQEFLIGSLRLSKLFEHTHTYAVDFNQPESLVIAIQLAEWT
jgi:hypothetical protein